MEAEDDEISQLRERRTRFRQRLEGRRKISAVEFDEALILPSTLDCDRSMFAPANASSNHVEGQQNSMAVNRVGAKEGAGREVWVETGAGRQTGVELSAQQPLDTAARRGSGGQGGLAAGLRQGPGDAALSGAEQETRQTRRQAAGDMASRRGRALRLLQAMVADCLVDPTTALPLDSAGVARRLRRHQTGEEKEATADLAGEDSPLVAVEEAMKALAQGPHPLLEVEDFLVSGKTHLMVVAVHRARLSLWLPSPPASRLEPQAGEAAGRERCAASPGRGSLASVSAGGPSSPSSGGGAGGASSLSLLGGRKGVGGGGGGGGGGGRWGGPPHGLDNAALHWGSSSALQPQPQEGGPSGRLAAAGAWPGQHAREEVGSPGLAGAGADGRWGRAARGEEEAEANVEELLSKKSFKEKEKSRTGEQLLSLLQKPTAKETAVAEKFKTKGGSVLREYCPALTKEDCRMQRSSPVACPKMHFRRILAPHTDVNLGDCSFLDTCRHMKSCKYVHYELDASPDVAPPMMMLPPPSPSPALQGPVSIPPLGGAAGRALRADYCSAAEHGEAQWLNCDVRKFPMDILGQFGVIMADPPWDIHMELPYGTMADDEMRNLNVQVLQTDGLIFLWVTGRAMELGRECLELWGYKRVEELIWVKTNQLQRIIRTGRTGHWLNHSKEHCLVGLKGSPSINRNIDTDVLVAEVRETSRKPDEMYSLLERMSPNTRKLEMFARMHNTRAGWVSLGNQLDGVRIVDAEMRGRFRAVYPDVEIQPREVAGRPQVEVISRVDLDPATVTRHNKDLNLTLVEHDEKGSRGLGEWKHSVVSEGRKAL